MTDILDFAVRYLNIAADVRKVFQQGGVEEGGVEEFFRLQDSSAPPMGSTAG